MTRGANEMSLKFSIVSGLALALAAGALSPALAQGSSCETDFQKLAQHRVALIGEINALAKRGKGKVDPSAMCSKLRNVQAAETQLVDYAQKNQEWCQIPEEVIANLRKGRANTGSFAAKACNAAVQQRKNAQAQRAGASQGGGAPQAPRLPAGPL